MIKNNEPYRGASLRVFNIKHYNVETSEIDKLDEIKDGAIQNLKKISVNYKPNNMDVYHHLNGLNPYDESQLQQVYSTDEIKDKVNLTKSQAKAVNRLLLAYIQKKEHIISFKAPTGSGKTFMASHLISQIFNYEKSQGNNKTMVVIATISDAELPIAFAKKIEQYKKYLQFNNFTVEHRSSPSNFENKKMESVAPFSLENNKVLIFGTSSFGKTRLFNEQGILKDFLYEAKNANWNIIYIRDEAHKGAAKARTTKEKDYASFDNQLTKASSFALQMTATPRGDYPLCELSEKELVADGKHLLKNNPKINPFDKDALGTKDVLNAAITKFKEIQKEYSKLKEYIRPAMLIQIDSKRKDQDRKDHELAIQEIVDHIDSKYDLNWLLYTSGKDGKRNNCKADVTLDEASKNDSIYDVIIFKVGASTGWDIPRANMLVQLRNVSSEMLNIQTLGRIKRNPYPGLVFNEVTDKYYVYTDYQEKTRKIEGYHLKDKFHNISMFAGKLTIEKEAIEEEYLKNAKKFFKKSLSYLDYAKENQSKKTLEYNLQYLQGHTHSAKINQKIRSSMRLRIWSTTFLKDNKNLFPTSLLRWMREKFLLQHSINHEIYLFTIKDSILNLKQIYDKAYETFKKKDRYIIEAPVAPIQFYQVWRDNKSKNVVDVTKFSDYGYTLVADIDKEAKNLQYLDSFPEVEAMREIIKELNKTFYKNKVKFFAKMPNLGSKVFFEYFSNKDIKVHKSFIDFAIIDKDNNVLMVEVKGHDDYSEDKTQALMRSYAQYMKKDSNGAVNLALVYAGKKEKSHQRSTCILMKFA